VRCHGASSTRYARCDAHHDRALLEAGLSPVEGGRTLAVYSGSLVELCGHGARQVYRAFPYERIDATDASGRPLVVRGGALLQWSPAHGWRRLFALPEPPTAGD
jgi:hypothetical protein